MNSCPLCKTRSLLQAVSHSPRGGQQTQQITESEHLVHHCSSSLMLLCNLFQYHSITPMTLRSQGLIFHNLALSTDSSIRAECRHGPHTYCLEPVGSRGKRLCAVGLKLLPTAFAMGVSEYTGTPYPPRHLPECSCWTCYPPCRCYNPEKGSRVTHEWKCLTSLH